jgi:YegS/Rv2252/BmrU family lipid kinase
MLRRRVLIILNPVAGRARSSRRRLEGVITALERRGCAVVLRHTSPVEGDTERLAREAEAAFEIIVAAGGDGTLNAVVNGVAALPRPIALLPLGTANVLAREIGLPRDPERLAELIATGPARPIWPGRVAGRLFLTMASSGFDAETVAAVDPRLKRHLGRLAFAGAIAACLWRYRACELTVRIDGVDHHAATVIAAKGRFYAGRYVIAPRADLSEPMLEFVLLHRSGRLAMLRYLAALLLGRVGQCKGISVARAREASISAKTAVPVQADGEIVGQLPVLIAIADEPLQLVQPPGPRVRSC